MKKTILITSALLTFLGLSANAQTWTQVGSNLDYIIWDLEEYNTELYAAGQFSGRAAKWNGTDWIYPGFGTSGLGFFATLEVYNSDLYVGGGFFSAAGIGASNIFKWDGSNSDYAGSGTDDEVDFLHVYNGELYASGYFEVAGGISVNGLAKWNGTNWSSVGTGVFECGGTCAGKVYAYAEFQGDLYVGGKFTDAGGISANGIAKWNGTNWSAVGAGVTGSFPNVYALTVYNNNLYAAGDFTIAGGNAANYIAMWDGNNWFAVGTGLDFTAHNLVSYNGELYVEGGFSNAGGIPVNGSAKWDGSSWSAADSGIRGDITAFKVFNGVLYATDNYKDTSGNSVGSVVKWFNPVAPTASFSAGTTSICLGESISFSDNSIGPPTSWNWTFLGGTPTNSTDQNPTVIYNTAGTYDVELIATNGLGTDTVIMANYITVDTAQIPPVPVINEFLGALSSSAATGNQWYLNGTIIPNATGQVYIPTQSGNYTVTVTNSSSCSSISSPYFFSFVGIGEVQELKTISVFPNPNIGLFNVVIEVTRSQNLELKLLNILGQEFETINNRQLTVGKNTIEIDLQGYPAGIYNLVVMTEQSVVNKKIIVE